MKLNMTYQQRQMTAASIVGLAIIALVCANQIVAATFIAWCAILFASRFSPRSQTATLVPKERDKKNRLLIARFFLWVGVDRRQWLLDAGTPADRSAFVGWQQMLLLLFVVATAGIIGVAPLIHPVQPRPLAKPTTVSEAGAIKAIELHDSTFSTSTTITTDTGVYQVSGAVSAAMGDSVKLKVTPEDTQATQTAKQEICITSNIKTACYVLR